MINVAGISESCYYYYHQDANGNVVALSGGGNGQGWPCSLIEKYEYLPYGGQSVYNASGVYQGKESTVGNPYMFTGRRYDEESGLYYYRARMYSSILGRFLQTDPLGYYDSMNLYQYCGNNPVNWVDPLGLQARSIDSAEAIELMGEDQAAHLFPKAVEAVKNTPWYIKVLIALGLYKATSGDEEKCKDKDSSSTAPLGVPSEENGFKPRKNWDGKKVKTPNGKGSGYPDKKNNVWEPTDHKGTHRPHWDVQHPDGTHTPVYPKK